MDALRGDTTGNRVCRAHNSSTTTKKRIRQVLCEDILKYSLTNLEGKVIEQSHISTSRLQAEKSFLMSHRAAGIDDRMWHSLELLQNIRWIGSFQANWPAPGMEPLCLCLVSLALPGNRGIRAALLLIAYNRSGHTWRHRGVQWPRAPMQICHNWIGSFLDQHTRSQHISAAAKTGASYLSRRQKVGEAAVLSAGYKHKGRAWHDLGWQT